MIGLKVLKEPWGQGGLALSDWQEYYLGSQMVFAHRWLISDDRDSATVLEAAHLGSYESLRLAIHRGTNLPLTLSIKSHHQSLGRSGQDSLSQSSGLLSLNSLVDESQTASLLYICRPHGVGD